MADVEQHGIEVKGVWEPRFDRVIEAFRDNFADQGDLGASFCAVMDGEPVVDIWGGYVDIERTTPWARDTIVNTWSTTKTMSFLVALMLADRGELDFGAPVARYWPEFEANGKEAVEVRHLMSHSAGLPGFDEPVSDEEVCCDWELVTSRLAAQAPWWEPGTASGYHALTQGFLIGEVVRRITGTSIGTFFRDEVAGPLRADFHIGVPDSEHHRISDIVPPPANGARVQAAAATMAGAGGGGGEVPIPLRMARSARLDPQLPNTTMWRRAEIPAGGGHGNARSVATVQNVVAAGGEFAGMRLMSEAGARVALQEQVSGKDLVIGVPITFAMGYALPNENMPFRPSPWSRSDHACFWGGRGGSTIVLDFDRRLSFSYVMNQMSTAVFGDSRGGRLGRALYECL